MSHHKAQQSNTNFGFAGADDDDNNNSSGGESSNSGGSHKLLTSARLQRHSNAHAMQNGTISSNPLLDACFPGVFPYNAPNGTTGSDNGSYSVAGLGFAFDADEVNNGYGSQGSNGTNSSGGNNNNANNAHVNPNSGTTAAAIHPLHGIKVPATVRNNAQMSMHRGGVSQSTMAGAQPPGAASFQQHLSHSNVSNTSIRATNILSNNTSNNNHTNPSATVSVSTGSNANSATNSVTGMNVASAAATAMAVSQHLGGLNALTNTTTTNNNNGANVVSTSATNSSGVTAHGALPQSLNNRNLPSTVVAARSTGSSGTKRRASNISTDGNSGSNTTTAASTAVSNHTVTATIKATPTPSSLPKIAIPISNSNISKSNAIVTSTIQKSTNSGASANLAASDVSLASSNASSKKSKSTGKKSMDDTKREERNMREKERSLRISQQINELRELLSTGGVVVPKGTKSSVLTEAANYIRVLQQHQYRSEMDRYQLVQQMQRIGAGALGSNAAAAIRHVASQNGVWSLGNFGGLPPRSALQSVNINANALIQQTQTQGQGQTQAQAQPQTQQSATPVVDPRTVTSVEEGDYRQVFNSCAVGMAIASMGGAFIDCNELFCQLSQYTKQELCAMTVFNLTSRDDLQNAFDVISSMISPPNTNNSNNSNTPAAPPVHHCVLKGAMKTRDDLGLSVTIIRSDEGVAKCFCVTLIHNQSNSAAHAHAHAHTLPSSRTASASFNALQQQAQQQQNTYMPPPPSSNVTVKQGKPQGTGPYFTTG